MTVTQDDADAIYQCVQCGNDYCERDNVPGACDYHPAISYKYHSWSCELPCCGKSLSSFEAFPSNGCTKGLHARSHHDRFPYINRLGHFRTMLQGSEIWLRVVQNDVMLARDGEVIGGTVAGNVGVLRDEETVVVWATQDGVIVDLCVISLQGDNGQRLLDVNQTSTLINDGWNKAVKAGGRKWFVHVDRISPSAGATGLRLSVQSSTGTAPNIQELHVDAQGTRSTHEVYDDEKVLTDVKPSSASILAYVPPQPRQAFRRIPPQLFDPVGELPIFDSTGELPLRVKTTKPTHVNSDTRPFKHDLFAIHLMFVDITSPISYASSEDRKAILNMVRDHKISVDEAERLLLATSSHAVATSSGSASSSGIVLVDVHASLCVGDSWIKADQVTLNGATDILHTVNGVDKVQLLCRFPAPDKSGQWSNRSFLTRYTVEPSILRLTFESATGQTRILNVAVQNPPLDRLPERDVGVDLFFLSLDHIQDFSRSYIKIKRPSDDADTYYSRPVFVIHVYNGSTTTHTISARTVRVWCAKKRLAGGSELPLEDISDAGRVEFTGVFDDATMLALRVKLYGEQGSNESVEDTWVVSWSDLS
ncbi:Aste57867_19050 [Aphanomyces stellatus]|uniref:Aste57867_19050 protein n=1 Tax=Aphanomyces stellatus TaxID=120398 RepID=A0A485LBV1_9STRA|nr:hypothetical protein As57867_018986 [Aphanomyces stellatus]VFT95775.1 Aste57867_19050 [Aphanomyces stellatus]